MSRNKRSISLNLKNKEGYEIFKRLVTKSDVVVQSFRPQTMERLGLSYDALSKVNERIIVASVSGFGLTGPYRERAGFGTLAEAMSGFASVTGEADGPPLLPQFALADSVAALYGVIGIMNAVYWRDMSGSGRGQAIDVSLIEPLFSLLGPFVTYYDQLGQIPKRMGSRNYANAPRNAYKTSDGGWVAVAASTPEIAKRAFQAIGRPEMLDDPRYATPAQRVKHVEEVDAVFAEWIGQRTRDEVMQVLLDNQVAAAPIYDIADVLRDPHMMARNAIPEVDDEELGSLRMAGVFPHLSLTPGSIRFTGSGIGAHNDAVYGELLGMTAEDIDELHRKSVI